MIFPPEYSKMQGFYGTRILATDITLLMVSEMNRKYCFDVEKFPIDDSFFETLGNQDSWDNKWNCHLKIYRSRCR